MFEDPMKEAPRKRTVPRNEIRVEAAASSGPGGQGVNTANSQAILHWPIGKSGFTEEEKELIRTLLKNRINKKDELFVSVQRLRNFPQNLKAAYRIIDELVTSALQVNPERIREPQASVKNKIQRERRAKKEGRSRRKQERHWRPDAE
ncbi:MAG TPA: peptide chain release factor-like protein [Patescibacteria group bacterium]|nr:peptide chain release factor-like protein [Patescibacteria group bacterium]